jgi:AbiU2
MADQELVDRANEVIDRLFALDDAVANARAFRALLENLHARDLSGVKEPHVTAITMVRAGILRSAIGTVMACLDPKDWRGNRASIGQIIDMLKDEHLVAVLAEPGTAKDLGPAALQRAAGQYDALLGGDLFERGRRFRNDAIAHVLIPEEPTPTLTYETIFSLHDAAEELVTCLYQVCDRGKPRYPDHLASLTEHARVFWDTYFTGMAAMNK